MTGRFLVTGSSGFLGEVIAAKLAAAGHAVVGIDPVAPRGSVGFRYLGDDLSDPRRLAGLVQEARPDAVIHAGGVSGPMVDLPPAAIMGVNVAGSVNLVQASEAAGVRRFVFCSSISAVGEFDEGPLPDDAPSHPETPYGASKAAVDQVLRGLEGRLAMQLCSLRLTNVYGAARRTSHPFNEMIAAAMAGRPYPVPTRPNKSCYVHVDDAADAAIAAAAASGTRQLIYNIAHPDMVSLEDVAAVMATCQMPVRLVPDAAIPLVRRGSLSVEAARRDLGFVAATGLEAGVRGMVEAARRGASLVGAGSRSGS